ncbi:MAG: indole-3-glycerol-phosphate synthase [Clostridiaceae bacterium]|jgi:indole-3-glycerol phosphate synthase|nr:indole-3-glycerol-phosphate synthase [Clostridiaceae bacterium]
MLDYTKCTKALWKIYRESTIPIIPDIKCKSPGEGDLIRGRDPAVLAAELETAGAPVISVVTEAAHFGGSPELLLSITKRVKIPVMRKDFITNRDMLKESAEYGASGVLLISSMLEKRQLVQLVDYARRLGLEPLVETHSKDEIRFADEQGLSFIGINNRDIGLFETDNGDVGVTEQLAADVSSGALVLSESALSCREDILMAAKAGAHAVLVGTAILKADNSTDMYKALSGVHHGRICT